LNAAVRYDDDDDDDDVVAVDDVDSREVGTDFHLSKVLILPSLHRDENRRTVDH